jgi:hypothetical protein
MAGLPIPEVRCGEQEFICVVYNYNSGKSTMILWYNIHSFLEAETLCSPSSTNDPSHHVFDFWQGAQMLLDSFLDRPRRQYQTMLLSNN